jgi:16S rRNA (uracil1498-N3)-methyltransferase
MARRRFFVPEIHGGSATLTGGSATLSGDDAHHLTRVLRVEKGQKYEISDNRAVYLAEVEAARRDLVTFRVIEQIEAAEAPVRVALYVALVRFERIDLLVEKATELGVERMAFFETERSERGLDRGAEKRVSRWQRIAREASEQSRRVRLPEIAAPISFGDVLEDAVPCRLLLDEEPGGAPLLTALPAERTRENRVSLMTGPEGGWTDRERAVIHEAGWRSVSLGPAILRTETAAIAALAVINAAWL